MDGDTYGQADVFELRPLVLGPSHDDIVARGLVVHVDHLLRGDVEVLPWRRGDVLRDAQQPEDSILSRLAGVLVVRWLGRLGEPGDVGLRGGLRHRVGARGGARAVYYYNDRCSIVYITYLQEIRFLEDLRRCISECGSYEPDFFSRFGYDFCLDAPPPGVLACDMALG